MGKNNANSWLYAVKKAFKSPSNDNEKGTSKRIEENEQEEEEKKRGKRRWIFGKHFLIEKTIQHKVAKNAISLCTREQEDLSSKQPFKMENYSFFEQKRAIAVAEAAVVNAVEIIRLSKTSILVKQHEAAVVIQTIFRGYLARRALLALKGVVKMQALIRGHNVRKRSKKTLQCIQSLVRVQALVCDQRRRLSYDATMFERVNTSRKSTTAKNASINASNNLDLEEIQALIQKATQCSLNQGNTLAHILSHETWALDEDQNSYNYQGLEEQEHKYPVKKLLIHPTVTRKDKSLYINQSDPIKTVEIDTCGAHSLTSPKPSYKSHNQDSHFIPSPKTPTSHAIYFHRMSLSENSCPLPRPNYMAATQSATARIRPHSMPRQRPSSPSRQQTGSARKRLSFSVPHEQRSNVPYYLTE